MFLIIITSVAAKVKTSLNNALSNSTAPSSSTSQYIRHKHGEVHSSISHYVTWQIYDVVYVQINSSKYINNLMRVYAMR